MSGHQSASVARFADFDGTSTKAVPVDSNDRTIVIWFKHFDISSGNMLAYGLLGEGNSVGFAVNVVTDELFVDNGVTAISLEGGITGNTWHFRAVTIEKITAGFADWNMYLNGLTTTN